MYRTLCGRMELMIPKMAVFFGTRIPNPREGEKNSFPRAKPEEKEFFYLPEGLEFLFQKNRHFGNH